MAISELLRTAKRFSAYVRPAALSRQPQRGPQFTPSELDSVPPSLLRWPHRPLDDLGRLARPSPILSGLGNHFSHTTGTRVAYLSERQRSLNAAARNLACPAPVGTFTAELAWGRSPFSTSAMTT